MKQLQESMPRASSLGTQAETQLPPATDIGSQGSRSVGISVPDPDRAHRDRLSTALSSSSVDSVPSSSSTSSTSSVLVSDFDSTVTETINSSCLADKRPSQISPRFKEALNWTDRLEIEKNVKLFDEKQQDLVQSIIKKQDEYGDGFEKGNYFANILPITASGFINAEMIVCCGAFHKGKRRPCRQWHLCSRCAYYKGSQAFLSYEPAFKKTTFSHLTCSFDGSLPLDSTNCVDLQNYWNAIKAGIRRAYNDGMIDGAYLVHELKIISFLPLRVLPHSHVLISGDVPTEERLAVISDYIAEGDDVVLIPSLVCPPINDTAGLSRVIKYQTKPIHLQEPYVSALLKHGRGKIRDLNMEMREFLDSYSAAISHFPKVIRFGNLQPQKQKGFIGTKKTKKRKKPKKPLKQFYKDGFKKMRRK